MSRMIFVNLPVQDLRALGRLLHQARVRRSTSSSPTRRPPAWWSATGLRDAAGPAVLRHLHHQARSPTPSDAPRRSWRSPRRAARRSTPSSTRRSRSGGTPASEPSGRGLHVRPQLPRPRRPRLGGHVDGPGAPAERRRVFTPATPAQHGRNLARARWSDLDPEEAAVLWRVRTTMSDRPGSLAALARHCGEQGVNILGLQIFPGVAGRHRRAGAPGARTAGGSATSPSWSRTPAAAEVTVGTLHRARPRGRPDPVPPRACAGWRTTRRTLAEMLARLLDADADLAARRPTSAAVQDTLVGRRSGPAQVVLRRTAPFTATEHARAVAFAEVAAELVAPRSRDAADEAPRRAHAVDVGRRPAVRLATFDDTASLMRMHGRCSADSVYRRYAAPLARIDDRFARRLLLGRRRCPGRDRRRRGRRRSRRSRTCEAASPRWPCSSRTAGSAAGLGTRLLSERGPAGPRARAPPRWCCAAAPTTRR